MAKKNHYLEARRNDRKRVLEIGLDVGWQQLWDLLCIALRDPDVMGKDAYGKKRLFRLRKAIEQLELKYRPAYGLGPEADYWQEKIDAELRDIYGDELASFAERYPAIHQLDYKKQHKEWR